MVYKKRPSIAAQGGNCKKTTFRCQLPPTPYFIISGTPQKIAFDIVYLLYWSMFHQRQHGGKGVTNCKFDFHTS